MTSNGRSINLITKLLVKPSHICIEFPWEWKRHL